MLLLLLDCSAVFASVVALSFASVVALVFASVVVFVGGFCASACFFASRAKRLRSASLLPEATRPGIFAVAGFYFGTSEVTRSTVSSGIVSSVCVVIVYI